MRSALLATFTFLSVVPSAAAQEGGNITLGIGQQKTLSVPGVTKASIGNEEVASVKSVGASEILLTGLSEGRTSLLLFKSSGRITYSVVVHRQDPREVVSEVRALLGDREGVQLRIVGDRIYMDGEALTTDDFERVQQITQLYPNVRSFVRASNNAKKLAAQNLVGSFQKAGMKNISVNVYGATIFLEGSVESKEELQKADLLVHALGESAHNLLTVGIKRMVLVEVQFVELRKSNDLKFGVQLPLNWQGSAVTGTGNVAHDWFPLPGNPANTLNVGGVVSAGSSFAFGAGQNNGYGRVLSQPRLVCASGEEASFHVGGEIPIVTVTANTTAIEFKRFGVLLKLKPNADKQGNITTDIDSEVSDIDRTLTVNNVPGFSIREVKTQVTVKHGETIVLSGIFNYDEQKNVSKFPLLGHIPIIGELLKSRGFLDKKTELAIFVTPKIVNPDSERIQKLIEDAKDLYKSAGDQVSFSIFD